MQQKEHVKIKLYRPTILHISLPLISGGSVNSLASDRHRRQPVTWGQTYQLRQNVQTHAPPPTRVREALTGPTFCDRATRHGPRVHVV